MRQALSAFLTDDTGLACGTHLNALPFRTRGGLASPTRPLVPRRTPYTGRKMAFRHRQTTVSRRGLVGFSRLRPRQHALPLVGRCTCATCPRPGAARLWCARLSHTTALGVWLAGSLRLVDDLGRDLHRKRPGRVEPRGGKRHPNPFPWRQQPRRVLREARRKASIRAIGPRGPPRGHPRPEGALRVRWPARCAANPRSSPAAMPSLHAGIWRRYGLQSRRGTTPRQSPWRAARP
jgi:hypothetical protein